MSRPEYITPEEFMAAITDALRQSYYRDDQWTTPHHPEDIAYNLSSAAEVVGAFYSTIIRSNAVREQRRDAGIQRILDAIHKAAEDYDDYHNVAPSVRDWIDQLNDAYVEAD